MQVPAQVADEDLPAVVVLEAMHLPQAPVRDTAPAAAMSVSMCHCWLQAYTTGLGVISVTCRVEAREVAVPGTG